MRPLHQVTWFLEGRGSSMCSNTPPMFQPRLWVRILIKSHPERAESECFWAGCWRQKGTNTGVYASQWTCLLKDLHLRASPSQGFSDGKRFALQNSGSILLLSPLCKGDAALWLAAGGLLVGCGSTRPMVPLAKGDKPVPEVTIVRWRSIEFWFY